jgi:Leucine-rich repeat (LRR) protein
MRFFCQLSLIALLQLCTLFSSAQELQPDTGYVFRSLSEALKQPSNVYKLSLKGVRLTAFPQEIFSFPHLRYLDLSRNRIASIPGQIGSLKELKYLNLSNNLIDAISDSIGQLQELVFLGLNRNQIHFLPATIGDLTSLEVLELWDNELEDVPDEISRLQNLRVLELRGILFSDEQQSRIDALVVKTAKVYMSPSCNCKN